MDSTLVTVGDFLTAFAVLISAAGVVIELRKDRTLKQKEIADRVRRSAGLVAAKADRWRQLSQGLFDEIHPLIIDADTMLMKERDVIKVRDFFWRELFALKLHVARRIMEEETEIAYADLYGYDPRIQDLFSGVIENLRAISDLSFRSLVYQTQDDIMILQSEVEALDSATLGNILRDTVKVHENKARDLMNATLESFRKEINRLVNSSDREISRRSVVIGRKDEILPPPETFQVPASSRASTPEEDSGQSRPVSKPKRRVMRGG